MMGWTENGWEEHLKNPDTPGTSTGVQCPSVRCSYFEGIQNCLVFLVGVVVVGMETWRKM